MQSIAESVAKRDDLMAAFAEERAVRNSILSFSFADVATVQAVNGLTERLSDLRMSTQRYGGEQELHIRLICA